LQRDRSWRRVRQAGGSLRSMDTVVDEWPHIQTKTLIMGWRGRRAWLSCERPACGGGATQRRTLPDPRRRPQPSTKRCLRSWARSWSASSGRTLV